jgi:hypothetical protein
MILTVRIDWTVLFSARGRRFGRQSLSWNAGLGDHGDPGAGEGGQDGEEQLQRGDVEVVVSIAVVLPATARRLLDAYENA